MTNNDILRRIRFALDLSDPKVIDVFAQADVTVSADDVTNLLKREEDEGFAPCDDVTLASFLNGLINDRRGKRDGPQVAPEAHLTNNMIFMKLKIALNLQADGVLAILALADFKMSRHELSALFRKPSHHHFRVCQDQILRNFLQGLTAKHRGIAPQAVQATPTPE